ncbi:hypothetical protein GDO81_020013 [Engystomops pustulosus]|uniref:Secreted protein n=1 Tax=Engystomops pustulosus TaxID=76066 RepID=A0AAV6Z8V3_ENGPU|nr:hypothetical protein GDO81_020013 [Engystomops pustulosus]
MEGCVIIMSRMCILVFFTSCVAYTTFEIHKVQSPQQRHCPFHRRRGPYKASPQGPPSRQVQHVVDGVEFLGDVVDLHNGFHSGQEDHPGLLVGPDTNHLVHLL